MRVVLDTNVLISACLKPAGLEARVVALARTGAITACVTDEILSEYRDVFSRKKFAGIRELAADLVAELEARALRVFPTAKVEAAGDEDDNRFLECAEAASADYLITGNLRHYPAAWGRTALVNARRFFDERGV